MVIGCHLSSAKGFVAMGNAALSIGANTFQYFTRNPRGGSAKDIDPSDANALIALLGEHDFGTLIAHAPYTLNACAEKPQTREFAKICMADDLTRMEYLPGNLYNLHPGSHVGQGVAVGIAQSCALLNELLTPTQRTTVLFETMAGQGSEIGGTFEELAELVNGVRLQEHIGVCLDTCHVYAAGYDVKNDFDCVLTQFDKSIGLRFLRAVHLNDSKFGLGSHRDRHARIGEGEIGFDALNRIAHHPALNGIPLILETPNALDGYAQEIRMLQGDA